MKFRSLTQKGDHFYPQPPSMPTGIVIISFICPTRMTLLLYLFNDFVYHYNDGIMSSMASQITSLTIVYSIVNSGTDQRKHQSSASLAFVRGIHWSPVNSPHKGPVMWKMFPFDDVIMSAWNLKDAQCHESDICRKWPCLTNFFCV